MTDEKADEIIDRLDAVASNLESLAAEIGDSTEEIVKALCVLARATERLGDR